MHSSSADIAPSQASYVGRFAPSPTGPLHRGSLVAALGSYLHSKTSGGRWLIRIDDIDPPREPPDACAQILRALDQFGLHSDAPVIFQRTRLPRYREVLDQLIAAGYAFPCHCTRSQLVGRLHQGRCATHGVAPPSWRLLMPNQPIEFVDLSAGSQRENPFHTCGDVVLWRADGWPSYQLASVVDDLDFGVTHIVRGADLLDSTARQIALMQILRGTVPKFAHLPLVLGPDGQKLSKQNLAPALLADGDVNERLAQLNVALQDLAGAVNCPSDHGMTPIDARNLQDFYRQAMQQFHLPNAAKNSTVLARIDTDLT